MEELLEKVQVVSKIPPEFQKRDGKILIVGGKNEDCPNFLKRHENLVFWYIKKYGAEESFIRPRLREVSHVLLEQDTPNSVVVSLQNMVSENVRFVRHTKPFSAMIVELASMLPEKAISDDWKDKVRAFKNMEIVKEEKSLLETPIASEKPQRKWTSMSEFVEEHAFMAADNARQEARKLHNLALANGIQCEETSVYQKFCKLKREGFRNTVTESCPEKTDLPILKNSNSEMPAPKNQNGSSGDANNQALAIPEAIEMPKTEIIAPIQDRVLILSEGSIDDDWFKPGISVDISFRKSEIRDPEEDSNEERNFPYTGRISSGKDSRIVLPVHEIVRSAIAKEFQKWGENPPLYIDIPCFLEERGKCWLAKGVDFPRLRGGSFSPTGDVQRLIDRLVQAEASMFRMSSRLEALEKALDCQKMLVIFDWQNFLYQIDFGRCHPASIVNRAANFMTEKPRKIEKVVIVCFENEARKEQWSDNERFEFYPVTSSPGEKNPTDFYIYKATFEYLEKLALPAKSAVAIISGDGHLAPLHRQIQAKGYQVIAISRSDMTSPKVKGAANFYMEIP